MPNSDSDYDVGRSQERRAFLGQFVVGTAAVAAAACGHGAVEAAPAPTPAHATTNSEHTATVRADSAAHAAGTAAAAGGAAQQKWDLSWTDKLTGTHRQVFDAPEISDGTVFHQVRMFYVNYKEVYDQPESALRAVLVIRHEGIPMVLDDDVWAKYPFIGQKWTKLKDPTTGEWARRNPFLRPQKGDKYGLVWPDGGLDALISRGAIVLGCNMALNGYAGKIAKETHQEHDAVFASLKERLVPGVTLVPSGIFGVIRAEEGGCAYIRAT
jgi:hypothetical protein